MSGVVITFIASKDTNISKVKIMVSITLLYGVCMCVGRHM